MSTAGKSRAPIEILFSGDLAEDDQMWIASCDPDELGKFIDDPKGWVAKLYHLADWTDRGNVPSILDAFNVQITSDEPGPNHKGRFIMQGITKTGMITIQISADAAASTVASVEGLKEFAAARPPNQASSSWPPSDRSKTFGHFWAFLHHKRREHIASLAAAGRSNPSATHMEVNVDHENSRFYAHHRIWPTPHNVDRPTAVKAFLCAYSHDTDGYVDYLDGWDQAARVITQNGVTPVPAGKHLPFKHRATVSTGMKDGAATTSSSTIRFTYSATADDSDEACDVVTGGTTPGETTTDPTLNPDTGTVKDYGG